MTPFSFEASARVYIRPFVFDIGVEIIDNLDIGFGAGLALKGNDKNGFDMNVLLNMARVTYGF